MSPEDREVRLRFPAYLQDQTQSSRALAGPLRRLVQFLIQTGIRLVLRPRRGAVGKLDISEVNEVYDREALTYDVKHHLTTRGMDTMWRRAAGWCAVMTAQRSHSRVRILDLCTGTGLTVVEMVNILREYGASAEIIGLDYNEKMLALARERNPESDDIRTRFIRGDAMSMVSRSDGRDASLMGFSQEAFDLVSQVFGIGGISSPLDVFRGVLQILKPGGRFFLIDMHRPIQSQPGEWPFFFRWIKTPLLEALTYTETTIPLALNRLWAWRDPTLDFYLLPLVTWRDSAGSVWGFKTEHFRVESERWWLSLPVMPVGQIMVEKEMITTEEEQERSNLLTWAQVSLR